MGVKKQMSLILEKVKVLKNSTNYMLLKMAGAITQKLAEENVQIQQIK